MGASTFWETAKGSSANEAFMNAVNEAQYMNGHGGYTGSIAEKHDFVLIDVPKGKDPESFANDLMNKDDYRIRDKWGPAGCVLIKSDSIKSTEVIPQKAKQTKVENIAQKGTRKWVTYYVLYQSGREVGKKEKKTEAIQLARNISLKEQIKIDIRIEKRLVGDDTLVAIVSPNKPKDKTKTVKKEMNEYLFFGWASS